MPDPIPCTCSGPGLCPRAGRQLTPHEHSLCRSRPELRSALREVARVEKDPPLPCALRGDVVRYERCQREDCQNGPLFPVHACGRHGECSVGQHGVRGLAVCKTCKDREEQSPSPIRSVSPIAVVVLSHNYGRFLAEAINSVLAQDSPAAEILVVDDASTDDTAAVAATFADRGVRYLRVECRSAHLARGAGLAATTAPWLCFLDADDELPADYLSAAQRQFADGIAIVYTDIQNFGDRSDRIEFHPRDISVQNFIHAGSVVRRLALESCRALERPLPEYVAEDWWTWRQVIRDGWKVAKSPALYRYRRHGDSRSANWHQWTHYERAGIELDEITIAIPFSGRRQWWPRLRDWIDTNTWPCSRTRVLFLDCSQDIMFGAVLRDWLAKGAGYRAVQYVRHHGEPHLADDDRRHASVYTAVQQAMPRIYNEVRRSVTTPWVLVVEDDILPPPDAAERLLRSFTDQVASVSGVYRSRYQDAFVAWPMGNGLPIPFTELGTGVQRVGGNGFGCVMLRTSVVRDSVFHHGGKRGDFDPNFCEELAPNWQMLLDWSVRCRHADLE